MRESVVTKLGDEFGDYVLSISCRKCHHTRVTEPKALARLVGWEIALTELAERLAARSAVPRTVS